MLWMILCHDRPDSGALRQQTRPAHLAHIAPLAETNRVRFAGPLLDDAGGPDGVAKGSLIVADFVDRAAAESWAEADPYALAGLFDEVQITPLRQVVP